MKAIASALLFALLCGCGVTTSRLTGSYPDGTVAHEVECRQDRPDKCRLRAKDLCSPFGREPHDVEPLVFIPGHDRWRLVITCGPPPAGKFVPAPPLPSSSDAPP